MKICEGRENDLVSYSGAAARIQFGNTTELTRCGAFKAAWFLIWSAIRYKKTYLTSHANF